MSKQKPYNEHFIEIAVWTPTSKPLNTENPHKSTRFETEGSYKYLKRPAKSSNLIDL